MTAHTARARAALAHMPETDPALAALALWCDHRDTDGATRTHGDTILYGVDFEGLSLPEQVGLAGHHILHVALRHGPRMGAMGARQGPGFADDIYNIAADALVNEALLQAGHALPRPALRLSEVLMAALGPQAAGPEALAQWDLDRLYLALLRDGADGARRHAAQQGTTRDLAPAKDGDREDSAAPDWQGRLSRAMATGQAAGRGLGILSGRLGDGPLPRTPWEQVLRGLVATALTQEPRQTHARPAKRWLAMDAHARSRGGPVPVFAPGTLRQRQRPRIAVGFDTSGSVDDDLAARFAAEITAMARRGGAEITVLFFDETVHATRVIRPGDTPAAWVKPPVQRGGGTAFGDVVDRAAAGDPAMILILTDLDGRFGPVAPRTRLIWAVPDAPAKPPPFGRVLELAG